MSVLSGITTITERGQTSIPAQLRKELSLSRGQQLLWERSGERELRLTVLDPAQPRGAQAMRGFARRFRASRSTAEWMADLRDGES